MTVPTLSAWAGTRLQRLATVPGLRVIPAYGARRFLRDASLAAYVACLAWTAFIEPAFLDPTHLGSDSSNYYAAGLRLDAGHPLYAQGAGDRFVPLDPPYVTVPLLSPPLIAVIWRVLAVLPGNVAMLGWWAAGLAACTAATVWTVRDGSTGSLVGALLLTPWLALTALTGNVNTFLILGLVAAWRLYEEGHSGVAGVLAGAAAAIKLTPILYLGWFLVRRDRSGSLAFGATLAIAALISLVGAGWDNHIAYLAVSRDAATAGITPDSLPGLLVRFGVPAGLAPFSLPLAAIVGVVAIVWLRRRGALAWTAAAAASVFAAPVVGLHSLGLLLPGLAPYRRVSRALPGVGADLGPTSADHDG